MEHPVVLALLGTSFTFLATVAGAAMVFFVKKEASINTHKAFLGFAAGVMIAASVWSLLIPAIDMAREQGKNEWLPAVAGFLAGGVFLFLLDRLLPHLHLGAEKPEGMKSSLKRTTMLVLAVTLHNIPESSSRPFLCRCGRGRVCYAGGRDGAELGMALQNVPEGAAISLPLQKEGVSKGKAFLYGGLSGVVEPVAGVFGALLAILIAPIMPFTLSFAAGAMIYVVVEELVPEMHMGEHSHAGTAGAMLGFAVMMVLDIALG